MKKVLYILFIILVVVFFIFVFLDLRAYNKTYSAPFSAYILVRALEFLLPALILLIINIFINKKNK